MIKLSIAFLFASYLALFGAVARAAEPAPMVHVATCNDGKEYYNATGERRGACSGHKGVRVWANGDLPKSSKGRTSYR